MRDAGQLTSRGGGYLPPGPRLLMLLGSAHVGDNKMIARSTTETPLSAEAPQRQQMVRGSINGPSQAKHISESRSS